MAPPGDHLKVTGVLFLPVAFLLIFLRWLFGINTTINGLVMELAIDAVILILFGVIITDTDHINDRYWFGKFLRHGKVAVPKDWTLRFHTFSALIALIIISILFKIYFPRVLPASSYFLPLLAYIVHMIVDGCNKAYNESWRKNVAPLPWAIRQFIRKRWPWIPTYKYVG